MYPQPGNNNSSRRSNHSHRHHQGNNNKHHHHHHQSQNGGSNAMNTNNLNHSNNHNHNNSNSSGRVTVYDVSTEQGLCHRLPNLRYHVFISKETTAELSDYILEEPWGDENGLLYKYLDYVWRCQLFDGEIKKMVWCNEAKLVFHSGLQRRSDGEFIYLLLIRNDADSGKKVDQKWRVALGIQNGGHHHNLSFVTRHELVQNHWPRAVDENEIPKRTLFYKTSMDLLFHSHYRFEMDWEERLRTCKNRIYKALSNGGNRKGHSSMVDEHVLPLKELQRRFEVETSKSLQLARANPRLGVPQAFIESKNGGYRLELLVPLTITLRHGQSNHSMPFYFALALRPHHQQRLYEGMSILTRNMGYANARLVGSIDSSWLTPNFASSNSRDTANNNNQHRPSAYALRHPQRPLHDNCSNAAGTPLMNPQIRHSNSMNSTHSLNSNKSQRQNVVQSPPQNYQHPNHPLSPSSAKNGQNANMLSPVVSSKTGSDHHGVMNPQNRTPRTPAAAAPITLNPMQNSMGNPVQNQMQNVMSNSMQNPMSNSMGNSMVNPMGMNGMNPMQNGMNSMNTQNGPNRNMNGMNSMNAQNGQNGVNMNMNQNGMNPQNAQMNINAMINLNTVTMPQMAHSMNNMAMSNVYNMMTINTNATTNAATATPNPYGLSLHQNAIQSPNPNLPHFQPTHSINSNINSASTPGTNANVNVNVNQFSSFPTATTVNTFSQNPYAAALLSVPMNGGTMHAPGPLSNASKPLTTGYLMPAGSIPSVGNPGTLPYPLGIPTVGPSCMASSILPIAPMSQPQSTRSAQSGRSSPRSSLRQQRSQTLPQPRIYSLSNSQNVTYSQKTEKTDSRSGSQQNTNPQSSGNANLTVTVTTNVSTGTTGTNTNSLSSQTVKTPSAKQKGSHSVQIAKSAQSAQSGRDGKEQKPNDNNGQKPEDKAQSPLQRQREGDEQSERSDQQQSTVEVKSVKDDEKSTLGSVPESAEKRETVSSFTEEILREASPKMQEAFKDVGKALEASDDEKKNVDVLDIDNLLIDHGTVPKQRSGAGMPRSNSCMLNMYTNSDKYHSQITSKTPPWKSHSTEQHSDFGTSPSHQYANGPGPRPLHLGYSLRNRSYDGNQGGMHRTRSMVAVNTHNPYSHNGGGHGGGHSGGHSGGHHGHSHYENTHRMPLQQTISAQSNESHHSNHSGHSHHHSGHTHSPPHHSGHHQSPPHIDGRYQYHGDRESCVGSGSHSASIRSSIRESHANSSQSPPMGSSNGNYPRSKSGYFFTPPLPYPDLQRGYHSPDPPMFVGNMGHDPNHPQFGENHQFGGYHGDHQGAHRGDHHRIGGRPGNEHLNGTVTVNESTGHNLNMNGDHHVHPHRAPRVQLTKSQSQPSLSEMLAMNVSPEQFEQFQAMRLEQKGQNVRYEPTITDAIQEDGVY